MQKILPKIIAVVGPTASGKSELAVEIAKKVGGEIISVDSRQIYRGMNIGTGKIPAHVHKNRRMCRCSVPIYRLQPMNGHATSGALYYKNIPHYGLDIASPKRQYSAAQFQAYTEKVIEDIHARGRIPILCGGTGQWVDNIAFGQSFPEVAPDIKLRSNLEKLNTDKLFIKLQKLDPRRAASIDKHNRRRLIRALEIVMTTGKPVPERLSQPKYDTLWIGIKIHNDQLKTRITKRFKARIKIGMLAEIKKLHAQGVSWKRLESFGLEYKFGALLLQKKITRDEFISELTLAIEHYAKRQMTWFKRNKQIHWVSSSKEAVDLANRFTQ